jgi:hypothetical protein
VDHPTEIRPVLKRGIEAARESKPVLMGIFVAW